MSNHTTIKTIRLVAGVISLALSAMMNAGQAPSIKYPAGASQIIITDLGLLPGGTFSSGLAINNEPVIVGLANDDTFAFQRPFWDANTGVIIGFADNFNPAGTAIPEHLNGGREMAGSEVFGEVVPGHLLEFHRPGILVATAGRFRPRSSHQGPRHQQPQPARGYG